MTRRHLQVRWYRCGRTEGTHVDGIAKPDRSAAEDLEQLRRENAKLKTRSRFWKERPSTSLGKRNVVRLRREESTGLRRAGAIRGAAGPVQPKW